MCDRSEVEEVHKCTGQQAEARAGARVGRRGGGLLRSFPLEAPAWRCVCVWCCSPVPPSSFTTMTQFGNLATDAAVQALDDYLGDRSYVEG